LYGIPDESVAQGSPSFSTLGRCAKGKVSRVSVQMPAQASLVLRDSSNEPLKP
jgi:hypothetical protein